MTLRILISMLFAVSAFAQAPIQRNSFTTNSLWSAGQGLRVVPAQNLLQLEAPSISPGRWILGAPSGVTPTNAIDMDTEGNATFNGAVIANLETVLNQLILSYASTNTLSMLNASKRLVSLTNGAEGTVLGISNGVPAYVNAGGGSTVTNTFNTVIVTNFYASTNNYTVGKGGKLTITNTFTILTNGVITLSNLPSPSVLVLNTDQAITNAILSGLSLSGNTLTATGGGGGGVDTSVTTLGWSGTNLTGFDCATNGATFKVTLTNNAFLADSTFANLPAASAFKFWTLQVLEDSTGGWALNATNTVVRSPGGTFPTVSTNANTITVYGFYTSAFTNSQLIVGPQIFGVQ